MTRREFAKCIGAVAGVAAIHGFSFANEGEKKMKCAVVYFSRSGNTRFAKLQLPNLLAPYVKTHAEAQRG